MYEEIIVSGAGGQGVLMLGEVLAVSNIYRNKKSTWLPSYGPEMRGGTANCSVVISDDSIGCPMIERPSILVAFNQPSITKFGPTVRSGGFIIVNSDGVDNYPALENDVTLIKVPANKLSSEAGNEKTINMVMLGALLSIGEITTKDSIEKALEFIWGKDKAQKLMKVNFKAIELGEKFISR